MNKTYLIYLLAFGGFVMATSEIVMAGILGMVAQDLDVSVGAAGQLVTVFAAVFGIGSPILVTLTSRMERKKLLILTFIVFIIGNLIAFFSPNFAVLVVSRVVLAASASVYTVVALTSGSSMAAPGRQGNAIGIIIMGFSTALVVGAPLGTLIGEYWGWRSIFLLIPILAIPAVIGIAALVPKMSGQAPIPLGEQLRILRNPRIVGGLSITFFWIVGYQLMFTYISPFLQQAAGLNTARISAVLLACGLFAVAGSRLGGYGADKWGTSRTLIGSLLIHAVALVLLPWTATSLTGALIMVAVWVGAAWMTTPVQQFYLVSLSPDASGLALGLNNSILQIGMAVGAGAGGWIVNRLSVLNLGWMGSLSIGIGLLAVFYSVRSSRTMNPGR
ncbi:MFS transporter [Cohnella xylanilytica]|uniref:MFS transporter n=1 Tax=Cohnella xylanilytica TaxID=557555 RepID=A0A841TT67_9BACL|nr:MFS transporter [Cohnella xylanilytica]MBB6691365.1 MFS transporter [Cohnella xylanilytica]